MDKQSVLVPGVGMFDKGKKIIIRDNADRVYRGHLQAAGDFLSVWEDNYLHCVRLDTIQYIGTEQVVEKEFNGLMQKEVQQPVPAEASVSG
jgi:hypothetical protein